MYYISRNCNTNNNIRLFQFAKNLKFLKKREKFGGFFFTDRGGFNCSAYQHPRRDDKYKYTVAGEKK
jgi:hypothetical protein